MKVDAVGAGQGKLRGAIHIADQIGMTGTAVLLRAVRDGRISLHISRPENALSFKNWARTTQGQPAVALIGDDHGLRRGAAAWQGFAYRMVRWGSHVMVHAYGAEAAHHEGAIAAAEGGARVLLIETGTASAPSWLRVLAAIPPRKTLVIWPRDGIHPIPEDRSSAN
jgi:hypothetical protein